MLQDNNQLKFVDESGVHPVPALGGLSSIQGILPLPDDSILLGDVNTHRVWRLREGNLSVFAGTGQNILDIAFLGKLRGRAWNEIYYGRMTCNGSAVPAASFSRNMVRSATPTTKRCAR